MATMTPLIPPEGVRVNSELFDALNPSSQEPPLSYFHYAARERDGDRILDVVRSPRPRPTSPPTSSPAFISFMNQRRRQSGSTLTRQPSIRRPPQSRTSDFSDFTSRRRAVIRETLDRRDSNSTSENGAVYPWGSSYTQEQSDADEAPPTPRRRARRFFGSGSAATESSVRESASTSTNPHAGLPQLSHQTSADLWYSLTSGASSSSSSPNPAQMSGGRRVIPRLRRGGVAAPESLLPFTGMANPSVEDLLAELHRDRDPSNVDEPVAPTATRAAGALLRSRGEQLLTPRSVSPAEES